MIGLLRSRNDRTGGFLNPRFLNSVLKGIDRLGILVSDNIGPSKIEIEDRVEKVLDCLVLRGDHCLQPFTDIRLIDDIRIVGRDGVDDSAVKAGVCDDLPGFSDLVVGLDDTGLAVDINLGGYLLTAARFDG